MYIHEGVNVTFPDALYVSMYVYVERDRNIAAVSATVCSTMNNSAWYYWWWWGGLRVPLTHGYACVSVVVTIGTFIIIIYVGICDVGIYICTYIRTSIRRPVARKKKVGAEGGERSGQVDDQSGPNGEPRSTISSTYLYAVNSPGFDASPLSTHRTCTNYIAIKTTNIPSELWKNFNSL